MVQDLGQQGRGGQTSGVHRARHRGGLDRGGERVALTGTTPIDMLHVLDDLELRRDDLEFAPNFGAHHMERVVADGAGPLGLGQFIHALFYRQMRELRVPLTRDFFLAFIRDGLGGRLERGSGFRLGLIKQRELLDIRSFLGRREATLRRQTQLAFCVFRSLLTGNPESREHSVRKVVNSKNEDR